MSNAMQICSDCYSIEIIYYCGCNQVFLCANCVINHFGDDHYLTDSSINLNNQIVYELTSLKSEILSHINSLRERVTQAAASHLEQIKSQRIRLVDPRSSPVSYSLTIDPKFQSYLDSESLFSAYLCDESNNLYKFSFFNEKCRPLGIEIDRELRSPFYLLEWGENLIMLGGYRKNEENRMIEKISLARKSIEKLNEFNIKIYNYYPVILNNKLYVIGGRYLHVNQKLSLNKVSVYDLNYGSFIRAIPLKKTRYHVAACFFQEKLWIVSANEHSFEILDLESDNSEEYPLNIEVTVCSALFTDGPSLFLFTLNGIYHLNEGISFELKCDFDNCKEKLAEEIWNTIRPPLVTPKTIFFIGTTNFISYSHESNSFSIEKLSLIPNNLLQEQNIKNYLL